MIANRLLFEAVYDWRCWHGQRTKYLFLLLGFALVCALMSLALRLDEMLFHEPPPWTRSDAKFFTLMREQAGLGARPLNLRTIDKLREVPEIDRVSWVSFREVDLKHDREPLATLEAVFFDPSLPELTNADFPQLDQSMVARSAWISERLFRQAFDSNPGIVGTQLRHERIPYPLTIVGVLEATFNKIGTSEPDIWLGGSNLGYLTPFTMPPPQEPDPGQEVRIRQFLEVAPIYYGIFTAAQRLDAETIRVALETVPDARAADSQVSFSDFEMQLSVLPGIDLAPEARRALRDQWVALIGLIVGLVIVLTVNAVTIFGGQWVLRWRDLGIMRIVGAGPRDFFRAQLGGLLPALGFLSGLSVLAIFLMVKWVENSTAWHEWAGERRLDVSTLDWLTAVVLVIVLLAICRGLPLVVLLRRRLFTRAVGTSRTGSQKILGQTALVIQLAGALLAVMIGGSVTLSEWLQHQNLPLDTSVAEIQIIQRDPLTRPAALDNGRFPGLSGIEVAAATAPVVGTGTPVKANHAALAGSLPVHGRYASANYFSVLSVEMIAGPAQWSRFGVVINRTLAETLTPETPLEAILGTAIRLETPFPTSYPIVGIIEDLPHLGRAERKKPAVYTPLEDARFVVALTVLVAGENAEKTYTAVDRWANVNLTQGQLTGPRTIDANLDEADRTRIRLLYSALLVALLISISVLTGMIYQVRSRLLLNQHEFGVRRAVGAPWLTLLMFAARDGLVALAMAAPLALGVQWILVSRFGGDTPLDLFHPSIMPVAILVIGLLLVAAAALPVVHSLRAPIFQILRED